MSSLQIQSRISTASCVQRPTRLVTPSPALRCAPLLRSPSASSSHAQITFAAPTLAPVIADIAGADQAEENQKYLASRYASSILAISGSDYLLS